MAEGHKPKLPEPEAPDVLTALSPLDGRYRHTTRLLATYLSEAGLIAYRLMVEVEYFIALIDLGLPQLAPLSVSDKEVFRVVYKSFSLDDARRVKALERTTNHDVKALEYFLKERWATLPAFVGEQKHLLEFVHFGLTSQDINNTAIPLSLKDALAEVYHPLLSQIIEDLQQRAIEWNAVPMLARTHGQAASPTTVGKELRVFTERLLKQRATLLTLPFPAKLGGATGNFNAHVAAYPAVDWPAFADHFVNNVLGLSRSTTTTQIEHYDGLAAIFDNLRRVNVILIDFCRDVWAYISMGYFVQQAVAGEVGSSAMPHKVNPIDFENAEGNLGFANALLDHLSNKLPVSRLQRDLTDSTVLRNLGVPLGHTLLALNSIAKGWQRLGLSLRAIDADLGRHPEVLAEALQTILRREGYAAPYEALKALTRGVDTFDMTALERFIHTLDVTEKVKAELLALGPGSYTGTAGKRE